MSSADTPDVTSTKAQSNGPLHVTLGLPTAVLERSPRTVHPADNVAESVGRTAINTVQRVVARLTKFASWITILSIFIIQS